MPARDYYLKGKGLCQREQTLCNVNSAPHTHTVAPVWRAERGRAPGGGGCVRSAGGRAAVCALRRTGGPSPGFGAFSSSPYTVAFVLGLGAQHRGIVELSEDRYVRQYSPSLLTYLLHRG